MTCTNSRTRKVRKPNPNPNASANPNPNPNWMADALETQLKSLSEKLAHTVQEAQAALTLEKENAAAALQEAQAALTVEKENTAAALSERGGDTAQLQTTETVSV